MARVVTAHPKVRENSRVLFFGDSLAQGLSPHIRELATEAGIPYVGAGVQGSRIDQWIASDWLDTTIDEFQPTLVLICLGTNDAYSNLTPDEVLGAMRMLLGSIPLEADVVWIGVPGLPRTYSGRTPNASTLQRIEEEAPFYFPSHELDIPRSPDTLHPNAQGYAGWAGAIWDWIS